MAPMITEEKTKMTRFDKMPSRWPYEGQAGHTNSTRKKSILGLRRQGYRISSPLIGKGVRQETFIRGGAFIRINMMPVCQSLPLCYNVRVQFIQRLQTVKHNYPTISGQSIIAIIQLSSYLDHRQIVLKHYEYS